MLRITLKRSLIGSHKRQKKILRSLGFKKLNQSILRDDIPSIRGMIQKVPHMVEVIKLEGQKAGKSVIRGSESK